MADLLIDRLPQALDQCDALLGRARITGRRFVGLVLRDWALRRAHRDPRMRVAITPLPSPFDGAFAQRVAANSEKARDVFQWRERLLIEKPPLGDFFRRDFDFFRRHGNLAAKSGNKRVASAEGAAFTSPVGRGRRTRRQVYAVCASLTAVCAG